MDRVSRRQILYRTRDDILLFYQIEGYNPGEISIPFPSTASGRLN